MADPVRDATVALGVTGSIAAYKAISLAGRLTAAGASVDVILTRSASRLVQPLAFQALTHRPVISSLWQPVGQAGMDHISVSRRADVFVVAPATANTIARLALGLADDALTTTALASRAPLVLAPAMEPHMWAHPATRSHVATLQERGATVVGPVEGRLASGHVGVGRLAELSTVMDHVRLVLGRNGDLAGRHLLVTAGPTREALDPVRFLSNRSSGRMGYAVGRAACYRGAHVTLVSGPVHLGVPTGVDLVPVETALEMHDAVLARAPSADAVVMAAAVADFRPAEQSGRKIKKAAAKSKLVLESNPDILLALNEALTGSEHRPVVVGFAAETENVVANARDKLRRKGLDFIVANAVPESFGAECTAASLVDASGAEDLGNTSKAEIADLILDRVAALIAGSRHP